MANNQDQDLDLSDPDPDLEETLATIREEARQKRAMGDNAGGSRTGRPEEERAMRDYCFPSDDEELGSSVVGLAIEANNFEIKTGLITLIQQTVQFFGLPSEDPNQHLIDFLETCDLVKFKGVKSDAIRLRLFKYSLRDKARLWLQSLEAGSITTWDELKKAFLQHYFSMAKSAKLRGDISDSDSCMTNRYTRRGSDTRTY